MHDTKIGRMVCVCHLPDRKKNQYIVAAMGTARSRVGWPPKEIGKIKVHSRCTIYFIVL